MTVLFVGLGTMGEPMAARLSPHTRLLVHDLRADLSAVAEAIGASAVTALTDLPPHIDTVVLMLPNSSIVEAVMSESRLLQALSPGSLIIDMGSSVPASTRRLAKAALRAQVDFVDAPVSGGVAKARTGELTIMMGGTEAAARRAEVLIAPLAHRIFHVGPPGAGHAAKALNNQLSSTNIAAAAEALTVAQRFGIEPDTMLDVINASTGRSQASEVKFTQHVLPGTFTSGFALALMVKDIDIAHDLAIELAVDTPVSDAARNQTHAALTLLGPTSDHTQVVELYEQRSAALLRTSKATKGTTLI